MSSTAPPVTIITDSVTCLPAEIVQRYPVRIVPINIYFHGKTYRDGVDLNAAEAYRMLTEDPAHFASAPASIGEYFQAYQEASLNSRSILVITVSSKITTMYNSARLAAELARQQLPQVSIEIVDSGTATVGEGLIVTAAARAVVAGKSLAEAAQIARSISGHVRVGGVLDDISHVYRTGRIPQLPAKVGAWLNIKPAFTLARGKIRVSGVFRSTEKGIDRLLSTMRKSGDSRPVHVAVAHAAVPDEGEKLQKGIESEFNCVESWLTDFSPVMAYATGPGVLVIAYYFDN